jgi:hypothetical protein
MTQQHEITPPPELLSRWEEDWHHAKVKHIELEDHIAHQAARWGADQELEACCEWLDRNNQWARCDIDELRDGRRPKPPSLKQQALEALEALPKFAIQENTDFICVIRRALESLAD